MNLTAEPRIALCDEAVKITITGLPAGKRVRLDASMRYPWAPKVKFESYAIFTADESGTVDLSKQKPDTGTYDYIDGMGLITSLQSLDLKALGKIGANVLLDQSLFIEINAKCEQEIASIKLERYFYNKDIKRVRIADDFIGELFYTENPNNKTVLFL